MEMTPTLILNLALLIVPPVALVLVFRQWLARHIRWTVAKCPDLYHTQYMPDFNGGDDLISSYYGTVRS